MGLQYFILLVTSLVYTTANSETRTEYACEGDHLRLNCSQGTAIDIRRANYGRLSISMCNPHGLTAISTHCVQTHTKATLKQM